MHEKSLDLKSVPGKKNTVKAVIDENDNGQVKHQEKEIKLSQLGFWRLASDRLAAQVSIIYILVGVWTIFSK